MIREFGSPEDDEAVMLECERLCREFVLEKPCVAAAVPEVVARRFDKDEVLFHFRQPNNVKEGGFPFAVVRLSWSGKAEPEMYSRIVYFEEWAHWQTDGMARDAAELARQSGGNA
jgi:hypothetical protein